MQLVELAMRHLRRRRRLRLAAVIASASAARRPRTRRRRPAPARARTARRLGRGARTARAGTVTSRSSSDSAGRRSAGVRRTRDMLARRKRRPRSRTSFGSQSSAGTGIGARSRAIACDELRPTPAARRRTARSGPSPPPAGLRGSRGSAARARCGRGPPPPPRAIRPQLDAACALCSADPARTFEDDQGVVALDRGGQAHARRSYAKRGRPPSQELHICRRAGDVYRSGVAGRLIRRRPGARSRPPDLGCLTSSLPRIRDTCRAAVPSVMCSSLPICRFVRPSATSSSTSRSRRVSRSSGRRTRAGARRRGAGVCARPGRRPTPRAGSRRAPRRP